jgi:hypothetical protein
MLFAEASLNINCVDVGDEGVESIAASLACKDAGLHLTVSIHCDTITAAIVQLLKSRDALRSNSQGRGRLKGRLRPIRFSILSPLPPSFSLRAHFRKYNGDG